MLYLWVLLVFAQMTGLMGASDNGDDVDEDQNCLPRLADTCFTDISRHLECHLNPTAPYNCPLRDVAQLCSAIQDGLNCASDIIDTDCSAQDGRDRFDAWMRGLRAVYYSLCSENSNLLQNLVQDSKCWNSLVFVQCVEREIEVSHVVDLLKKQLDVQMCNHFLIAMSTCNVHATQPVQGCEGPQGVIREILHTFFSQSACGAACLRLSDSAAAPLLVPHWGILAFTMYAAIM